MNTVSKKSTLSLTKVLAEHQPELKCKVSLGFLKAFWRSLAVVTVACLAQSLSAQSLVLSWIDDSQEEEGYLIERSSDGVEFTEIAEVAGDSSEYVDTNVETGEGYSYRLRAYNVYGYSDYTDVIYAEVEADDEETDVGNTDGGSLVLHWLDNAENENGFSIERSTNGLDFVVIAETDANVTSFVDNEVIEGLLYYYRLRAFNFFGYSDYTEIASCVVETEHSEELDRSVLAETIGNADPKSESLYEIDLDAYSLTASGSGFGQYADGLQFTQVDTLGDFDLTILVHGFATDGDTGRVGLMVREDLEVDSKHESIAWAGSGYVEHVSRESNGSSTSVTKQTMVASSVYLRATRQAGVLRLRYSEDGVSWFEISGGQAAMSGKVHVGIVLGSEVEGRASVALVEVVESSIPEFEVRTAYWPYLLGQPMKQTIVGEMSDVGEYSYDSIFELHRLSASGLGYEIFEDAVRYSNVTVSGDIDLSVRLSDFAADGGYAKSGIMLRSGHNAGAAHFSMVVNGQGHFEHLSRSAAGERTSTLKGELAPEEAHLRIKKQGDMIYGYYSYDGVNWTLLKELSMALGEEFNAGLVLGSQADGQLSECRFEVTKDVQKEAGSNNPGKSLSLRMLNSFAKTSIIGVMSSEGFSIFDEFSGLYFTSASGLGYEPYADALRYTWVPAEGDFSIKVQIHDYEADGSSSRIGLMLRESLNANAPHASVALNGNGDFETLIRSATNASVAITNNGTANAAPKLRIDRVGDRISLFASRAEGGWKMLEELELPMSSTGLLGVAIGSQTDGAISSGIIEFLD